MRENWTYKKLGEVTTTINGLWTGKKPPFINVAVVRNTNFTKDCKLDMTNIAYLDVEQKQYNSRKLFPGDIIIEKSGGSDKQPVGRPVLFDIPDGEYSFSNFTSTLRIKNADEVIPQFLHYVLYGAYLRGETFKLQSKTTGIHNLDFKGYNRLPIPVPSLSEQQSIVAELDKINELISLKKAQLSDLDSLAQSIFYDMFGDPIENEKGWELKKFGDVVVSSQIGLIRSAKQQGQDKAFAYFKMNNITISGDVDLSNLTKVDACKEEQMKYILKQGDFLFNTRNSYELVGKSCVYNLKDDNTTLYNNNLLRIIFDSTISPTYISYLFKDKFIKKQLDSIKKGTTNVWAIYYKDLSKIKILAPPLSLQQEFAKRIELIEQQKAQISSTIKDLETLLASRMQYWFD